MTLVKINIKNVASETHPDDRVIFYSPTLREAPGGGITSTAEVAVPLVDGVGEKELVPGPVTVTFQCRGISDTRPKSGTVPDTGPVDIADVIGDSFTYTAPEVNRGLQQIATARDEAVAAVTGEFDEVVTKFFPVETAREGMGLLWDGDGFRWSWLDQFKDTFADDH